MNLPHDIQKSFESFAQTLIAAREEIATLEQKYGTTSSVVLNRRRTLQIQIEFYKHMSRLVPEMYHALRMAAINQESLYIMEMKRSLGVSWPVAKDLLHIPEDLIKDLVWVDDIIARIMIPGQA